MADISFAAGTVGLGIPFVLYDGISLLSSAGTATITWFMDDGSLRVLSLASAASAEFTWTTSALEFRIPTHMVGQLRVSIGVGTFWTSSFTVAVHPVIRRPTGE